MQQFHETRFSLSISRNSDLNLDQIDPKINPYLCLDMKSSAAILIRFLFLTRQLVDSQTCKQRDNYGLIN